MWRIESKSVSIKWSWRTSLICVRYFVVACWLVCSQKVVAMLHLLLQPNADQLPLVQAWRTERKQRLGDILKNSHFVMHWQCNIINIYWQKQMWQYWIACFTMLNKTKIHPRKFYKCTKHNPTLNGYAAHLIVMNSRVGAFPCGGFRQLIKMRRTHCNGTEGQETQRHSDDQHFFSSTLLFECQYHPQKCYSL